MRGFRRSVYVLKRTGAIHIFWSFVLFVIIAACVLVAVEPQIQTFGDGLWYCFVASTTIGFGDIYAVTAIGRIVTVVVAIYGIMVVAMVPGVVLAYYLEYIKEAETRTVSVFMEQLELLPELSEDELREISQRVKDFKKNIK